MGPRVSLVREFAVRSLVVTVIAAVVLAAAAAWLVRDAVIEVSSRAVRTPVQGILMSTLSEHDFGAVLTGDKLRRVDDEVRREIVGGDLVGLKVINPHGMIVYSTLPSEMGDRFRDHAPFDKAMAGGDTVEVESGGGDGESADAVRTFGTVVESYAPLRMASSGRIVGAYETYSRYQPVGSSVMWTVGTVWVLIMVLFAGAYSVQIQVVRRAEQRVRASEAELADTNERLKRSLRELESHAVGTLQALISAVDAKDSYTASHSIGVADCALAIGRELRLDDDQLLLLERASLLHDIGKIGVSEVVLLKPAELDAHERDVVEEHALTGARMVESMPFLADVAPIIRHHHERWDGQGYPDHVAGEDIPLLARVLGVADAYDAMTSDRPYRSALSWYRVRQQLRRGSGTQFDPHMVAALLAAMRTGTVPIASHDPRSESAS